MPKPKPTIRRAHQQARASIERYIDRAAMPPSIEAYQRAHGGLIRQLGRALRGRSREEVDRRLGVRIANLSSRALAEAHANVAHELTATSRDAAVDALRGLGRFVRQVSGSGSAVDDEVLIQRIAARLASGAAERHARVMSTVAADIDLEVRRRIALGAIEQESVRDVLLGIDEVLDQQAWRIARAVRTQTSNEYNAAMSEGVDELADETPGVRKRWTELVDDVTHAPLDNRVGRDSIVLHGQLAAGGMFTMPDSPGAPAPMVGMQWAHPPNRPNDRAVITAWAPRWGIPAWQMRGGERVSL